MKIHSENNHNLDVMHLGCCTNCGGTALIPNVGAVRIEKNLRVFYIDEVRKMINLYLKEEINLSKLTEMMNEKATGLSGIEIATGIIKDETDNYPKTVDDLSDYNFFILNVREHTSIAINIVNENEYRGITFYKTNLGWSLNPTKIGKGYLTNIGDYFDYTGSFLVAKDNADQTR